MGPHETHPTPWQDVDMHLTQVIAAAGSLRTERSCHGWKCTCRPPVLTYRLWVSRSFCPFYTNPWALMGWYRFSMYGWAFNRHWFLVCWALLYATSRVCKAAWWVKALVPKPNYLNSTPGPARWKARTNSRKLSSDLHSHRPHLVPHIHTYVAK